MVKSWLPLEANPEVMNKFVHGLGVPSTWGFSDIYGVDAELLDMVPTPVRAVLLLFPITDETETQRLEEHDRIQRDGQIVDSSVFFTEQTIGNACGTIALVHAVLNNADQFPLAPGFFTQFRDKTASLTPSERAAALEQDATIEESHVEASQEGQSEVPGADEVVVLHFVCFVERNGHIYELDGRKKSPINHGETSADKFLQDAVSVIKTKFMDANPDSLQFTMIAFGKLADE